MAEPGSERSSNAARFAELFRVEHEATAVVSIPVRGRGLLVAELSGERIRAAPEGSQQRLGSLGRSCVTERDDQRDEIDDEEGVGEGLLCTQAVGEDLAICLLGEAVERLVSPR